MDISLVFVLATAVVAFLALSASIVIFGWQADAGRIFAEETLEGEEKPSCAEKPWEERPARWIIPGVAGWALAFLPQLLSSGDLSMALVWAGCIGFISGGVSFLIGALTGGQAVMILSMLTGLLSSGLIAAGWFMSGADSIWALLPWA